MQSSVACGSLASLAWAPLAGSTRVDQVSRIALDRAPGPITCWNSRSNLQAKSPPGRYRPRMRGTGMLEPERLLKLKGGFIPTVN